jgi:hypothetical protein
MNYDNTEIDLKTGEYILTSLQGLLINRALSSGIKLETQENFIKSTEIIRQATKKQKISVY